LRSLTTLCYMPVFDCLDRRPNQGQCPIWYDFGSPYIFIPQARDDQLLSSTGPNCLETCFYMACKNEKWLTIFKWLKKSREEYYFPTGKLIWNSDFSILKEDLLEHSHNAYIPCLRLLSCCQGKLNSHNRDGVAAEPKIICYLVLYRKSLPTLPWTNKGDSFHLSVHLWGGVNERVLGNLADV
jgi:hypothetical protein